MEAKITLPKECISKLKCVICKKYLSVPPISGCKGSYKCGRCEPFQPNNDIFEEVAKYIVFPCANEDCPEKLSWGKVTKHEQICAYAMSKCPVSDCDLICELRIMSSHFEIQHMDFKFQREATSKSIRLREISSTLSEVFCIKFGSFTFVGVAFIGPQKAEGFALKYYCGISLYYVGKTIPNLKYKATIQLMSTKEATTLTKTNQEIQRYQEKYFQDLQKLTPQAEFRNLLSKDGMAIQYSVEVYDVNAVNGKPQENIHTNVAKILECPLCMEYMSEQIYNCASGHSMCADCHKSVSKCPYCRKQMSGARNYMLEELAEKTKIQCRNKPRGCGFVAEVKKLKNHELNCNF